MYLVNSLRRLPYVGYIAQKSNTSPIYLVSNQVPIRKVQMSAATMSPLKRKAEKPVSPPQKKKAKVVIPEYHLTPSRQDESGEDVWPARAEQIGRARSIIKEW